jgi:hypothetical protein
MKRCIIHIGMHKTGSTSIQRSLQGFRDDRFQYARLGKTANHSLAMYSLFVPHPEQHPLHKTHRPDAAALSAYVAEMRAELERTIDAARGRTLLISGEDISVLPPDSLTQLRDHFRGRFDEITVVGYVRPPGGYMASGFQQRAREGAVSRLDLAREYRNYRQGFSKFDDVFGRGNVHLWKFDPGTFPGNCAVRDFCSRLGIALPVRRIVRFNESLSRQAVGLLYTYYSLGTKHGFYAGRVPQDEKLGALLAGVGSDKFRFSPDAVRPVLEKNQADIKWMEARLGQSLHEDLGSHRPGDVREESDLLNPDPAAVGKLLALLGRSAPAGIRGETPEEVAQLMHAFRKKHVK